MASQLQEALRLDVDADRKLTSGSIFHRRQHTKDKEVQCQHREHEEDEAGPHGTCSELVNGHGRLLCGSSHPVSLQSTDRDAAQPHLKVRAVEDGLQQSVVIGLKSPVLAHGQQDK